MAPALLLAAVPPTPASCLWTDSRITPDLLGQPFWESVLWGDIRAAWVPLVHVASSCCCASSLESAKVTRPPSW